MGWAVAIVFLARFHRVTSLIVPIRGEVQKRNCHHAKPPNRGVEARLKPVPRLHHLRPVLPKCEVETGVRNTGSDDERDEEELEEEGGGGKYIRSMYGIYKIPDGYAADGGDED